MVGGGSTHIPLKVNTAGVIPIILASSLMQFPVIIAAFADKEEDAAIDARNEAKKQEYEDYLENFNNKRK